MEDVVASSSSSSTTLIKKGPWSAAEDAVLIDYVRKHGEGNWNAVQRSTALQRCGKSCRLRWANHLRPNLKKGPFSSHEEHLIIDLHAKLGNKWARISAHLPGRTDNEVKNYWNTRVKRRLRQGLPLYPKDHTIQSPPLQPPRFTPSNPTNTLPLFDPASLSTPLFTLHHPRTFLSSHPMKCSNPFLGRPIPSPSQLGQFHPGLMGFNFGSGLAKVEDHLEAGYLDRCGSSDFVGLNFELPSNQLLQNVTDEDDDPKEEMKINANVGGTNSGLLEDMLQEAQEKVGGGCLKRERDDFAVQWDLSSSENSSSGIKKEDSEEWQLNSINDDLSNILELIPSLVQVPSLCDDGQESSVGQSSIVSTDDNCNGLDQPRQPPAFPAMNGADCVHDDDYRNPGCCSWDNLPGIC